MLAKNQGSYELLHPILPERHLHCFNTFNNVINAASLLESLGLFQDTIKHIKYLDLFLKDVLESVLSAFCPTFVSVKSLHLQVSKNDGVTYVISI
jgi:hypothetical protein